MQKTLMLFTLEHTAYLIGVSPFTVRTWLRRGKIQGEKDGMSGWWYFELSEINRIRKAKLKDPLTPEEAKRLWESY